MYSNYEYNHILSKNKMTKYLEWYFFQDVEKCGFHVACKILKHGQPSYIKQSLKNHACTFTAYKTSPARSMQEPSREVLQESYIQLYCMQDKFCKSRQGSCTATTMQQVNCKFM